ncbi:hypothetical protein G6F56_004043 [Rhizopus delemar]|nr:hypothetical protein G6F56_004043 [Rhizopus delemar]
MEQIGRTGVAAMHAVLLNEKSILIIDKAEDNEAKLDSGVSAFSSLYDIETNTYQTLELQTNTFCSAGGFLANGTFISTGGAESRSRWNAQRGHQSIRHFEDGQWQEYGQMFVNRWYPTVEQLPEGDLIIIGGSIAGTKWNTKEKNSPSYEFWPPRTTEPVTLDLLLHTLPYNLSYPLTAGAVMLPLDPAKDYQVEILICGGGKLVRRDNPTDDTCGRINLSDKEPRWEMDTFIHKRVMPDGLIMADGNVLWVNGCQKGYAGYNNANHDPTFDPLIYQPENAHGERWQQGLANTDIARMYHSVALPLPDGRVWIAGSNSVDPPDIHAEYPTEYRVEYFYPPYLFRPRPRISHVPRVVEYDTDFDILFHFPTVDPTKLRVALMRPGFSTHSMHMSQRYVYLVHEFKGQSIRVAAPPHPNIFPPGSGYLVVVYDGVPSKGVEIFVEKNTQDLAI